MLLLSFLVPFSAECMAFRNQDRKLMASPEHKGELTASYAMLFEQTWSLVMQCFLSKHEVNLPSSEHRHYYKCSAIWECIADFGHCPQTDAPRLIPAEWLCHLSKDKRTAVHTTSSIYPRFSVRQNWFPKTKMWPTRSLAKSTSVHKRDYIGKTTKPLHIRLKEHQHTPSAICEQLRKSGYHTKPMGEKKKKKILNLKSTNGILGKPQKYNTACEVGTEIKTEIKALYDLFPKQCSPISPVFSLLVEFTSISRIMKNTVK